jgi:hypothetical protein
LVLEEVDSDQIGRQLEGVHSCALDIGLNQLYCIENILPDSSESKPIIVYKVHVFLNPVHEVLTLSSYQGCIPVLNIVLNRVVIKHVGVKVVLLVEHVEGGLLDCIVDLLLGFALLLSVRICGRAFLNVDAQIRVRRRRELALGYELILGAADHRIQADTRLCLFIYLEPLLPAEGPLLVVRIKNVVPVLPVS